ncbi:MAG: energy transducer TonB [Bacteroidales bacterium]|nr:energy transducer TonB [Bacteroidales bacterium]
MKKEEQKTESLEEIVFRHRNKTYGAYQLRRDYRKFITISMIFALFVTSAAISYPLVTAIYYKPPPPIKDKTITGVELKNPKDEQKPKPEIPEAPEPEIEKVRFVVPVVVDSAGDESFGVQSELEGKINTEVPEENPVITIVEDRPAVIEQPIVETPELFVEIMPEFPGGVAAMRRYLSESIKYPENAKELGIQGMVYINFVVEKDGSITKVKLLRGIGEGCDEEALRVVRAMPKWHPGSQQGKTFRVSYNLPVRFTLR